MIPYNEDEYLWGPGDDVEEEEDDDDWEADFEEI